MTRRRRSRTLISYWSTAAEFLRGLFRPPRPDVRRASGVSPRTGGARIDLKRLESVVGCPIGDPQLFIESLTHRSYLPFAGATAAASNERLEFLGDAILNLTVAEHLFRKFPNAEEGDLTRGRARLVNRKALGAAGHNLHLDEMILASEGAKASVSKGYDSLIADAFEAVIAAVYIDSGPKAAIRFIARTLLSALPDDFLISNDENYKSVLLELAQAHRLPPLSYAVVREEGPDHDRRFTVQALLGDTPLGVGEGKSKKEAEQRAAADALFHLRAEDFNLSLSDPSTQRPGSSHA